MRFVIINLTDRVIPITRTNMEKVILAPHKPYVLETMHTPEIKFWQSCTDSRFKVMTDSATIDRYLKVLKNQENVSTVKVDTPVEKQEVKIENKAEIKVENINTEDVEVVEEPVKSDAVTPKTDVVETENTKYSEEQLIGMKVTELKSLAAQLGIALPNNANKSLIIETIYNNQ